MSDEATIAIAETVDARVRSRGWLAADLATSYALAGTRVGSNAIVVGLLYRYTTATWVAAFVLMRSMLSIVNYALAGLGPATLRELVGTTGDDAPTAAIPVAAIVEDPKRDGALDYATPPAFERLAAMPPASRRANAFALSMAAGAVLGIAALMYGSAFPELHSLPLSGEKLSYLRDGVVAYAIGMILRGTSEAAGAASQWAGRLAWDNSIAIGAEMLFACLAWYGVSPKHAHTFNTIGNAFVLSGLAAFTLRWILAASFDTNQSRAVRVDGPIFRRLAIAAGVISAGSFADFLYAPANVVLINQCLDSTLLAAYGPALQIDAALLLSVASVAPVLLPRIAGAIAADDLRAARRMYAIATLAGLGMLTIGAAAILAVGRPLLRLWLGEVPPLTISILPFLLVHTVIGGTAGIGRAVLLGMGRFKAYTISALVGGVANVALALLFVLGFGWGLRGVVFATIVAVVGRCAIWMPWYILRALRAPAVAPISGAPTR